MNRDQFYYLLTCNICEYGEYISQPEYKMFSIQEKEKYRIETVAWVHK